MRASVEVTSAKERRVLELHQPMRARVGVTLANESEC